MARGRAGGPPARGGGRPALRPAASAARGQARAVAARGQARAKANLPGEDGPYLLTSLFTFTFSLYLSLLLLFHFHFKYIYSSFI